MNNLQSKEEITAWLEKHGVKYYTIEQDFSVNVYGNVDLSRKNLNEIPVRFNKVQGIFDIRANNLTSLENSPQSCQEFLCTSNLLTNLKYAPQTVHEGRFHCDDNRLTSLEGCPQKLKYLQCSGNALTSLKHSPLEVELLGADENLLTTLEHCPQFISASFRKNQLLSLKGCPQEIKTINCDQNNLKNLEGCPKIVHDCFMMSNNFIETLVFFPEKANSIYLYGNSKLGAVQGYNFEEAYKIHLIEHEQYLLSQSIEGNSIKSNKSTNHKV